MPIIAIVECNKCRKLLLANLDSKTRACPYCGNRVVLSKAKKFAIAKDAFEASDQLRKFKAQRQGKARNPLKNKAK
jgi:DNA-directed RNA polymerase subunit RPC12/RpoP